MKDWTKAIVSPDASISEAIQAIDRGGIQIAFVVDEDRRLIGVLTDGDVRRGLLNNFSLEDSVAEVMNARPQTASVNESQDAVLHKMQQYHIRQIPRLDADGRICDIVVHDDLVQPGPLPNWAFLMAGGLGSRLRPLTDNIPKPMLKVGDRPIIETALLNLIGSGFNRFYVSVNYKADIITDFLGDGSKWNVEIRYIREKERLGTAGALSLIPESLDEPILVTNSDLLTTLDFSHLLDFHVQQKASATMCVRQHQIQVPYGVVQTDQFAIQNIEEKPFYRFFINAGIYLLDPGILNHIPKNKYFDMPELFEILVSSGYKTAAFPLREYWRDVGRLTDYQEANGEFTEVFG